MYKSTLLCTYLHGGVTYIKYHISSNMSNFTFLYLKNRNIRNEDILDATHFILVPIITGKKNENENKFREDFFWAPPQLL